MKKIFLKLKENSYPIYVSSGNLDNFVKALSEKIPFKNAVIITTETVSKIHAVNLENILKENGYNIFIHITADGERSKSFNQFKETVSSISKSTGSNPFFIIALGGGVTGDLAGFVASTYKRSVSYVQVPTTLLAQVDSSIGGKTAIDLDEGKNLLGTFYQPKMVYSNTDFLKTLPEKEIKNGIAEIIKYGIIEDKSLFNLFEEKSIKNQGQNPKIFSLIKEDLEEIIYKCSKIKSKIVSADEKDVTGRRAVLNFGHTIGHALEAASGYSQLYTHGEAVSVGMVCAVDIAKRTGILKKDFSKRLISVLEFFGLPVWIEGIKPENIMEHFWYDKKFTSGVPRMVLPVCMGKVKVIENISKNIIEDVIKSAVKA